MREGTPEFAAAHDRWLEPPEEKDEDEAPQDDYSEEEARLIARGEDF